MSKILAITNCRVSTPEQELNNSLKRQRQAVVDAAKKLGAAIPDDGQWSGNVSSKKGGNLKRGDIRAMLEYCKRNRSVKYLIVDEPDRFMRSIDEAMYLEMKFKLIGVKVWYASDEDLNGDDLNSKLMKFLKYFVAEGSNDDRQDKSIRGQTQAIKEGRYPFRPKFGYKKGEIDGIHDINPLIGSILKDILIRIASHLVTPTQALKELNGSDAMDARSEYKMDKFRKIITDPYYAGIVEMNKQVKARNEYGLHEPLITIEQHKEILRVMSSKPKNQKGPRKNGNPEFPLDNILHCVVCSNESTNNRFVGFNHTNGVTSKIYTRYRCRSSECKRYIHAEDVHSQVKYHFEHKPMTELAKQDLKQALKKVWRQQESTTRNEIIRLNLKAEKIDALISSHVDAMMLPSNDSIQDEIRRNVTEKKAELKKIKDRIDELEQAAVMDKEKFLEFALDYVDDLATHFFELPREKQLMCKQLVFPSGFWVDENKKVYTPEISELYRLATQKKDTEVSEKSLMVRVRRL